MGSLPRTVKWYAITLLFIAQGLLLWAAVSQHELLLSPGDVLVRLLFIVFIACAGKFPLHVSTKTNVVVDTALIFAALLLFPVPWGPMVAGFGVLFGHLLFNRVLLDTALNTAVVVIEGLCVQWTFVALGGHVPVAFTDVRVLVPLCGAGVMTLLVERLLVAVAIAICKRANLLQVFAASWQGELTEDLALLLLGVLTALVVRVQSWALLLTLVPIALVYISLRNSLRLRQLTRGAVEELVDVVEKRDAYTAGHSVRVSRMAERVAIKMQVPWEQVEDIRAAARVHDLGKVTVDSAILTKPGRLTSEESALMRHHPETGAQIIARFPEFSAGVEYIRYHHERCDGQGYPHGLKGEQIPLGASIIAAADAYDAMTSDRPYRKALSAEKAREEFERGKGMQWDRRVVEALFSVLREDGLVSTASGTPQAVPSEG